MTRSAAAGETRHDAPTTSGAWLGVGLAALLALAFGLLVLWAAAPDQRPPEWDEAVHLHDSLVLHNVLRDPTAITIDVVRAIASRSDQYPLLRPSGFYPPLVAGVTALTYFGLPATPTAALLSNILFLVLLTVAVQRIGTLTFDRRVGWAACVLILTCPILLADSTHYMLDMPLTAMLALALWLLLRTDDFRHPWRAALFGLACGLGMLTKWTFVVFIVGPAALLAIDGLRAGGPRRIGNVALAAFVALATFGPYYLPILGELWSEARRYSGWALAQGPGAPLSLASAGHYARLLWTEMASPALLLLAAIGLVRLAHRRDRRLALPLVGILLPWAIFTFAITNKQARYLLPLLIWLALIAATACAGDWRRAGGVQRARLLLAALLVALAVLDLGRAAWRQRTEALQVAGESWPIAELATALADDLARHPPPTDRPPPYLGVLPDHHFVNGQTLRYFTARRDLPLNVIKLQRYDPDTVARFVDELDRYTYLVTKDALAVDAAVGQASTDAMQAHLDDHAQLFEPLYRATVADGSVVTLLARRDRPGGP